MLLYPRSRYHEEPSVCTKIDGTIDIDNLNTTLVDGKTLQFLNCLGRVGSYYMFDQWTLHDSLSNTSDKPRIVLFVTVAIGDVSLDNQFEVYDMFYESSKALSKDKVLDMLSTTNTVDDFIVDSFGKILLKPKCV